MEKFRICGAKGMGRADALPVPTNRIGGILTSRGIWCSTLFGYNKIDVKKISDAIEDTTNTMYADNRYIELTKEQLDTMQEKE